MLKNRLFLVFSLVIIASMMLAACQPTEVVKTVIVTEVVTEAGEEVIKEVVVTATPEPEAVEPKIMVICMAQEPTELSPTKSDLVTSLVREALFDVGADNRSFDYQPVGLVKLPKFDDGDATQAEVTVKVGDTVYDAATDEVVTIVPTTTVTLNQLDGTTLDVDFAVTPEAKTVQLTASFTLVDGVTWEDGTPVTTKDMVFSWDFLASPDVPSSKYLVERSASFVAVDDKTTTWTGLPGYTDSTYFLNFASPSIPAHVYGEGGTNPLTPAEILQDEAYLRDPLAHGAFKLEEWEAGNYIRVVKNPTYYRASEGLPKMDEIIFRFVPDTNQLIAQLVSGECDLGTQDAAFEGSLPLIRQFEAQGLLVPQVVSGTVFEHLDFNIKPVETYQGFAASVKNADGTPIFANPEIRQAINYCLDKQAISDQTTNGGGVVQTVYVPSAHPMYAGDENIAIFGFDPAKGLELLAKNGWTDTDADGVLDDGAGQKFAFVHATRTNALRQKVTQVVQAQLKENCMIETTIELQGGEFFEDGPVGPVFGRQYDMGEFAWLTGSQPPCNLYQGTRIPREGNWGDQNNTGWENAEYDAACTTAMTTLDKEVEKEQHIIAQKLFAENVPSIILFARGKILVHRPEVVGVIMDVTNNSELWNIENFDFVK